MATTAGLLIGLWLLRRLLQQRELPPPPWRLPAVALLLQVAGDPLAGLLPEAAQRLLVLLQGLIGSYALVALTIWALLQLPAALGLGRPMPQILRDLLAMAVAALLTVLSLQQAGVNLVGLVTTSAVLTAVIGLAAQETLKDLFGGLSMQIGSAFRVGDWVDLGQQRGWVDSITLMNTVLRTLEGAEIVVPNSQAAASAARRIRLGQPVGHRFTLGLEYSHPPAQAMQLLLGIAQRHSDVLTDPPPQVWIKTFGESAVEYELLVFQRQAGDGPQLSLRGELLQQIWYALHREGRSIPFPVLELRQPLKHQGQAEQPDWDNSKERAARLRSNPLFVDLCADELAELASMTRCLRYGPGEVIVSQGDPGDCLYQVLSGAVEVQRREPEEGAGGRGEVATLRRDEIFGEMTLLTDAPRNATVVAAEETELLEVERRDLAPLLKRNPDLLERLSALVKSRQQELLSLNEEKAPEASGWLLRKMRILFT